MTYQTKAALREEIYHLQSVLKNVSTNAKFQAMDIQLASTSAAAAATRGALELVLRALEITDYTTVTYGTKTYATNQFRDDLETALRVRAEKKQAEEDAATEARIAGLAKKDSGGTFSGGYVYPGETIYSANDVKSQGAQNLEYISKLARTYLAPQSETAEKATKKPKGDKK